MNDPEKNLQISFDSFKTEPLQEYKTDLTLSARAHIGFAVKLSVGVNEDKDKKVKVLLTMTVDTLYRKKNPTKIARIVGVSEFIVRGLELPENKTKDLSIPDKLLVLLTSMTYSTLRGAFIEKSKGTRLEGNILPIIDPKDILKNPVQSEAST